MDKVKRVSVFQGFAIKKEDSNFKQIIADIKEGKYKREVELIRYAISDENTSKAKKLKRKLLAFTPSGVYDKERKSDNLLHYSRLVIIDIDNLNPFDLSRVVSLVQMTKHTLASFKSPSGNGIKIIVPVDSDKENHKNAYNQIAKYYQSRLKVEIDTSGSDLQRLCYLSYDPDCYINELANVFPVKVAEEAPNLVKEILKGKSSDENQSDIEKYIRLIEEKKIDITRDYYTWVKIGFALSQEFGELGRDYFHRVSKFHKGYDFEQCSKQYTKCLESKGDGINISSFYYLAHQNNIKPLIERNNIEEESISGDDRIKVPYFPQTLYPQLPKFIQSVIHHFEDFGQKDIMILTTLTVISACFTNLYGIYDDVKVHSNLYLFIVGQASAGKGKIILCKRLVNPIQKSYNDEYKRLQKEYNDAQKNDEIDEQDKPKKPQKQLFFIPANSSSTGIFELLGSNGGKGLIFENEAETLANSFKSDYGNYSEGFRKANHHETISYYRRTNKEHVDIENPRLSTVLSGTPNQVLILTPNAEDGLFSRFMFYYMEINTEWKDVFHRSYSSGLGDLFDLMGEEFFSFFKLFSKEGEIEFSYTKKQEEEFLLFFSKLNNFYLSVNDYDYIATTRRMGLIAFRISMVLSVLRCMETNKIQKNLICSDIDFRSTLDMIDVLIKHSSKIYSGLQKDKSAIKYGNKKEQFLNSLPHKFSTKGFEEIARKLSIQFKTAEGYITDFVQKGTIRRVSQGNYENPNKF